MPSETIASNSNTTFSQSGYTLTLGDNVTVTISGSNDVVIGGQNDFVVDSGDDNTVALSDGATLFILGAHDSDTIGASSSAAVNGIDDTVTEGTGSYAALQGSGDTGFATGTGRFNLAGDGQTATVADGGYIGVVSGTDHFAHVNDGTVLTLDNVEVTVVGSGNEVSGGAGSYYNVNGNDNTVTEGAGSFANLNGSGDTGTATGTGGFNVDGGNIRVTVADGAYVGVINGSTGATINDNGGTVYTLDHVGATINGTGTTIFVGSQSNAVVSGNSNKVTTLDGTQLAVLGHSNSVTLGAGDFLNASGGNDSITSGPGDLVLVQGTNGAGDVVTATGDAAGGTSVNGLPTGIYVSDNAQAAVYGSGNSVGMGAAATLSVLGGGGNTIDTQAGDLLVVSETNGAFDQINGSNDVDGGTTADGRPTGIHVNDGAQANLSGNGNTVLLGTGASLGAYGGGNTIDVGANDTVVIGNTDQVSDTVLGSNDAAGGSAANGQPAGINLNADSQANVFGSNDKVGLSTGDSLGVYGGGNVIGTQAGDLVYVADTDGVFDEISGNDDEGGQSTADNEGTGIYLSANAQANVSGSGNSIGLATGDSLGAYGGGDLIDTGSGDLVVIGGTGGTADTVYSNGDLAGGTAANGQPTGINLDDASQAEVYGSYNTIGLGTGDSLGVHGGGNTINTQAGNIVAVDGTNGHSDDIFGSGDFAGGLTANGQPTGIGVNGGSEAFVFGSNDFVTLGAGSNAVDLRDGGGVVVQGDGGTVSAFNVTSLTVSGSADTLYTDNGVYATVTGTSDTVNLNGPGSTAVVYNTGTGANVVREDRAGDATNVQNEAAGGYTRVELNSSDGYAGLLGGSGYGVFGGPAATGGKILTLDNTTFDVAAQNLLIGAAAGDSVAVSGGGNTIDSGPGVQVAVNDTYGDLDTINANGDTAGVSTANGQPAGVYVLDGSQANIQGNGNTALVTDNSYLGVIGNGNAVLAGANTTLVVNGNGNATTSLSGGSVTFAGTGNSASLNDTALYSADGNPITFTGIPSDQGNVPAAIAQSQEVADDIDEVYLEVLGRSVDPSGLATAQATLAAGGTLQDVRTVLATSAEALGDFSSTLSSIGADPATAAETAGFEALMSSDYNTPIILYNHLGQVLANTAAPELLAELPVLDIMDNGRTLSLGLAGSGTLSFVDMAHLTDFLYAVAVQKSQAAQLVTDTFNEDLNWLNQVDQPMLSVADQSQDLANYDIAIGKGSQAKLWNVAAQTALNIAAEAPGSRTDSTEKVSVDGHETAVTVYAGETDAYSTRFHDIDPGIVGILESVGIVILDAAAVVTGQPLFLLGSAAIEAAQAGQEFANGQAISGVISLASAAGAFEGGIGNTELAQIINTAAEGVGGVYGAVQSAQNENVLGVLAGALEATAAVAGGIGEAAGKNDPFLGAGVTASDDFTIAQGADIGEFTNSVAQGLSIASTAISISDAFRQGDMASGLVASLSAIVTDSLSLRSSEQSSEFESIFDGAGVDASAFNQQYESFGDATDDPRANSSANGLDPSYIKYIAASNDPDPTKGVVRFRGSQDVIASMDRAFHLNEPAPHLYVDVTAVGTYSDTTTAFNAAMLAESDMRFMPAPGVTLDHEIGALEEQVTVGGGGLAPFNAGPVETHWDAESGTVINITDQGHIFYDGYVMRQISVVGTTVYITTVGQGNSKSGFGALVDGGFAWINGTLGPAAFQASNSAIADDLAKRPGYVGIQATPGAHPAYLTPPPSLNVFPF